MITIPEIAPNVYYTGADDHTTFRFEGLWALPWGVSYNSYIVSGDRTALIDGVELHKLEEQIRSIKGLNSKPDYLIVNHMEPDHSGSIPGLIDHYPNLRIVGNAKTIAMIQGFYHIDEPDRFITVKDGDTLDLGQGLVLKFFLTPMIHWPETMMTYLESREVLFSGDAFGTFGALNGAVEDNYIDDPCFYFEEMFRYFAAIVAKYGRPVQMAMNKLSSLKISRLCSTHGPVWHKLAGKVIQAYSDLSTGVTRKGVVIAYGSMYGNTGMMIDIVARRLREKGVESVSVYNLTTAEQSRVLADIWRYNGLVLASPTYNANIFPPVEALIKALEVRELKNRKVGLVGSYAWAQAALPLMKARVEGLGLDIAGEVNMKLSPDDDSAAQAVAMADALAEKVLAD